ncbi:MAG: SDR family oxidoreductase [Mucilaginibacter polytrichastri]|nr:SDR family oxidoreductase [Mucilaginibacter polytrichastri]
MIAITGANGNLGKAVTGFLLEKTTALNLRALVRNPETVQDLADAGAAVFTADYDDPASLGAALSGVDRLLHVSAIAWGEAGMRQEENVVRAAQKAGVKHIVYTSALMPNENAAFYSTRQCLHTERLIRESGIPFTFFRNSLYMETIPLFTGDAAESGTIYLPAGDGCVSFVYRPDIAEAIARVLLDPEAHRNRAYEISGSEALSFEEIAGLLTKQSGRTIAYADIPENMMREDLAKTPMPAEEIDWFLSLTRSIKAGEFAGVDPALEQLLGRPPKTVAGFLAGT